MELKALGNFFLFEFLNETAEGRFVETTRSGIILTNQDLDLQTKFARWGRVISTGDKIEDFKVGDIVLIEYGQWTTTMVFEDRKYWKSDETKVCAITNDESVALFT